MRAAFPPEVEHGRDLTHPVYGSRPGERMGSFRLRCPATGAALRVIVSDGADWDECGLPGPRWEHVSVTAPGRTPVWEEMSWVKNLFFLPDELAVEFHPPHSRYVNCHPHCLHLWRPVGVEIPMPPVACV